LAQDSKGNIFVSDTHQIRKIDSLGLITTVAGSPKRGYAGDGGPAFLGLMDYVIGLAVDSKDNLYAAEYGNHVIRKITF
jgi:hypothetical protein